MMRGIVNSEWEPVVRLRVIGPTQAQELVDALVDTGSTGSLVLPPDLIARLDLVQQGPAPIILADGSRGIVDTYAALIDWDGTVRGVIASALGSQAIIGMGLLDGHELRVEATIGGVVEIRPLVP